MTTHTPIDRALELTRDARALVQHLQREQLRTALDAGRRRLQGGLAGVQALDAELATLQREDAEHREYRNPRPQVECCG